MAVVAVLNTIVQAQTGPFEAGMDRATEKTKQFRGTVDQQSAGVQSAFANLFKVSGIGGMFGSLIDAAKSAAGQVASVFRGTFAGIAGAGPQNVEATAGSFARAGSVAGKAAGSMGLLRFGTIAAVGSLALFAAAAIGGGIALERMAAHGAETISMVGRLSRELGISTELLSTLGSAPGVDMESMAHGVMHFQRAIEDGGAGATRALAGMGLSLAELREQSPDQQLESVIRGFGSLTTQGERSAAAMGLFGRAGFSMMDLLQRGGAGLDAARDRAARFGTIITPAQVDQIKAANRAWSEFGTAMKGIGQQAAVMFAPVWEALGKVGGQIGEWLVGAFKTAMPAIQAFGSLVWNVVAAFVEVGMNFGAVQAYAGEFGGSLSSAFGSFMPWLTISIEVLTAFVSMFRTGAAIVYEFGASIVGGVFRAIGEAISPLVGWIGDLIGGWRNLGDTILNVGAVVVAAAHQFRQVWSAAIDDIKLHWLQLQRTFGLSVDTTEIARLQASINRVFQNVNAEAAEVAQRWRDMINGLTVGVSSANQAATRGLGDARAGDHGFAGFGSEAAFRQVNAADNGAIAMQRRQTELQGRMAGDMREIRNALNRAPTIRRARL